MQESLLWFQTPSKLDWHSSSCRPHPCAPSGTAPRTWTQCICQKMYEINHHQAKRPASDKQQIQSNQIQSKSMSLQGTRSEFKFNLFEASSSSTGSAAPCAAAPPSGTTSSRGRGSPSSRGSSVLPEAPSSLGFPFETHFECQEFDTSLALILRISFKISCELVDNEFSTVPLLNLGSSMSSAAFCLAKSSGFSAATVSQTRIQGQLLHHLKKLTKSCNEILRFSSTLCYCSMTR